MSSSVAKCVVAPSASSSILDGTPCAPTGSDQRARATVVPIGLVRISWPLEASPLSSNWPLTARAGQAGRGVGAHRELAGVHVARQRRRMAHAGLERQREHHARAPDRQPHGATFSRDIVFLSTSLPASSLCASRSTRAASSCLPPAHNASARWAAISVSLRDE